MSATSTIICWLPWQPHTYAAAYLQLLLWLWGSVCVWSSWFNPFDYLSHWVTSFPAICVCVQCLSLSLLGHQSATQWHCGDLLSLWEPKAGPHKVHLFFHFRVKTCWGWVKVECLAGGGYGSVSSKWMQVCVMSSKVTETLLTSGWVQAARC